MYNYQVVVMYSELTRALDYCRIELKGNAWKRIGNVFLFKNEEASHKLSKHMEIRDES
jgi:hypothetical protein